MKKLLILVLSMLVISCTKKTNLSDLYKDKNFYTYVDLKENTDTIIAVNLCLNSDNREKVSMNLFYDVKPDTLVRLFEKNGEYTRLEIPTQGWRMSCLQIGLVSKEYEKTAKPFNLVIDDVKYVFEGEKHVEYNYVTYFNTYLSNDEVFVDKLRNAKSIFVEYGGKKEDLISLKFDAIKLYKKYKELKGGVFIKDTKIKFDCLKDVVDYGGNPVKFYNTKHGLTEIEIKLIINKICSESEKVCSHPLTFKPKECKIFDDNEYTIVSLDFEAANSFNVPSTLHSYAKYKDLELVDIMTF
jgi:hypothetical protein